MKTISAEETKQAVYSRINFELPLEIWEEIVSAFGTYWNRIGSVSYTHLTLPTN